MHPAVTAVLERAIEKMMLFWASAGLAILINSPIVPSASKTLYLIIELFS
jgi:hypothetical protein